MERAEFTKKEDSYNCGVFICSFIEKCINYDFNYKINRSPQNLLELRKAIHKKLSDNAAVYFFKIFFEHNNNLVMIFL